MFSLQVHIFWDSNYIGNHGNLTGFSNFAGIAPALEFSFVHINNQAFWGRGTRIFQNSWIFAHFKLCACVILDGNFVDVYFSIFPCSFSFWLLFCILV